MKGGNDNTKRKGKKKTQKKKTKRNAPIYEGCRLKSVPLSSPPSFVHSAALLKR